MNRPVWTMTSTEARAQAESWLDGLDERQLEARWNWGPTTGSILAAIIAEPDSVRCLPGMLDEPSDHPATSTVYVRPPTAMRISVGPSQFYGPQDGDNDYVHPDWCECDDLLRFARGLGLDPVHGPDEILPERRWHPSDVADIGTRQWYRLWWD